MARKLKQMTSEDFALLLERHSSATSPSPTSERFR
jgi:hypothetical protein